MTRICFAILLAGVLAAGGCGDNSKVCGPGTMDMQGTCVPSSTCGPGTKVDPGTGECVPDGSVVCTDGTMFDTTTGTCVVDPNSCQDGTVLIGGQCVDPTRGLVIDLDEGMTEPNGLNVIEASSQPAGVIQLKPIGGAPFVIHGRIAPFEDKDGDGQLDPDVDSYLVSVTQPTLLDISVDGVDGIDGAFVSIAPVGSSSPLVSWSRFGINLTGDTSRRQLLLPAPGTYVLAIADSRTLFRYSTGGPQGAAPGPGDYYVSISQLALPPPVALASASQAGTIGSEVQLFAVAMGTGFNQVTLAMPTVQASPSIVVLDGSTLHQVVFAVDPNTGLYAAGGTAQTFVAGFAAADSVVVAVDDVYNFAVQPASYTLTVATSDAQLLAASGTASETETTSSFDPTSPLALQQFYFDATTTDETFGLSLAWNHPVVGALYDDNLHLMAQFTPLPGSATWTSYAGLVRLAEPGRYYFLVYDPAGAPGTTQLTATSTVAQVNPVPLDENIPSGTQTLDPVFQANAFAYTPGVDPWQTFDSTGTGTGGQHVTWFDPTRAYGRLDALATSAGTSARNIGGGPIATVYEHTYGTAGGAIGRIVLDDPSAYYITVDAPNATGTFDLSFAARAITDLGTLASSSSTSSTDHSLDAITTTAGYFLFRTPVGYGATITVHPHDPVLLDTEFQRVTANESALGPLVDNPTGDDTETFTQAGTGWTAWIVTAATPPATAQPYDVTVTIGAP